MILIAITLRYLHCGHLRWNAMVCRCQLSCLYFFLCVPMFYYTKYYTFHNFSYKSGKKCIAVFKCYYFTELQTSEPYKINFLLFKYCEHHTTVTQIVIQFHHHIYGQPLEKNFQNIKKQSWSKTLKTREYMADNSKTNNNKTCRGFICTTHKLYRNMKDFSNFLVHFHLKCSFWNL